MKTYQKEIVLDEKHRGFHLITGEILKQIPEIKKLKAGTAIIFLKHTSASLILNENADPDVRTDMERYFDRVVPEGADYFDHTSEGDDDMPSHVKSAMLGSSLTIPVTGGEFNLGTWQGIYLCEHRNKGGKRKIVVTLFGE